VDADQDALAFSGPPYPIRDYEMVFEVSYAAQIAPWWTIQPDLQIIVHPGGNVADPDDLSGAPVSNAVIAGIRSTINF
jgi:porin